MQTVLSKSSSQGIIIIPFYSNWFGSFSDLPPIAQLVSCGATNTPVSKLCSTEPHVLLEQLQDSRKTKVKNLSSFYACFPGRPGHFVTGFSVFTGHHVTAPWSETKERSLLSVLARGQTGGLLTQEGGVEDGACSSVNSRRTVCTLRRRENQVQCADLILILTQARQLLKTNRNIVETTGEI